MLVQTLMMRRKLDRLSTSAAKSVCLGLRLYEVKVKPAAIYGSCHDGWGTRFHMVSPTPALSIWKEVLQDSCQSCCAGSKCWLRR